MIVIPTVLDLLDLNANVLPVMLSGKVLRVVGWGGENATTIVCQYDTIIKRFTGKNIIVSLSSFLGTVQGLPSANLKNIYHPTVTLQNLPTSSIGYR